MIVEKERTEKIKIYFYLLKQINDEKGENFDFSDEELERIKLLEDKIKNLEHELSCLESFQIYCLLPKLIRKRILRRLIVIFSIIFTAATIIIRPIKFSIIFTILLFIILGLTYQEIINHRIIRHKKRLDETHKKLQKDRVDLEKLRTERLKNRQVEIRQLEEQVEKWLAENLEDFIKYAKQELDIQDLEEERIREEELPNILNQQIPLPHHGIKSPTVYNKYIRSGSTDESCDKDELYIDSDDFYSEVGLDGKRRYGVYEFSIIFLCTNFLSYCKCYWNFVKQAAVNVETCEYLYDTIVSVKTKEESSLRIQNPEHKRTYREILSITTMDGRRVDFRVDRDRKRKIGDKMSSQQPISDVREAAKLIRYMLRQRRIDYMRTKPLSESD